VALADTSSETPAPTARRRRPPPRRVEVTAIERLTPNLVRVTVGSDAMEGFELSGPASHIKIFLPAKGESEPTLPVWGPDGPSLPEGASRPTVRTYTPRRFDPATNQLDIELVVHGAGPASSWADWAELGDRLAVAGPGRHYEVDTECTHFVIAGDDTAVPAIGTLLEGLPASATATVLVESAHPEARPDLPDHPGASVAWLEPAGEPGDALAAGIADVSFGLDARIWVACEAGAVRRIRRAITDERGFPAERLVTRGYWKIGEADHPDGDYGQ
jgi:NADPH-dependent ferric siderophore reductase